MVLRRAAAVKRRVGGRGNQSSHGCLLFPRRLPRQLVRLSLPRRLLASRSTTTPTKAPAVSSSWPIVRARRWLTRRRELRESGLATAAEAPETGGAAWQRCSGSSALRLSCGAPICRRDLTGGWVSRHDPLQNSLRRDVTALWRTRHPDTPSRSFLSRHLALHYGGTRAWAAMLVALTLRSCALRPGPFYLPPRLLPAERHGRVRNRSQRPYERCAHLTPPMAVAHFRSGAGDQARCPPLSPARCSSSALRRCSRCPRSRPWMVPASPACPGASAARPPSLVPAVFRPTPAFPWAASGPSRRQRRHRRRRRLSTLRHPPVRFRDCCRC